MGDRHFPLNAHTPSRPECRGKRSIVMVVAERIGTGAQQVDLIAADKALMSLRSSGHDYGSAVGEVIDNSLQAEANVVRLRVFTTKKKIGSNAKATEVVERLAIGDDG